MEDIQNKKPPVQNPNDGFPVNVAPTGGPKERERPVSDFVKPSEELQKIDKELTDIGVEQPTELPKLDSVHEQIGVTHAPADTPVRSDLGTNVQLPMTDTEAKRIMDQYKNKVTYDIGEHGEHDAYIVPSILGLATLTDKIHKLGAFFKNLFGGDKKTA